MKALEIDAIADGERMHTCVAGIACGCVLRRGDHDLEANQSPGCQAPQVRLDPALQATGGVNDVNDVDRQGMNGNRQRQPELMDGPRNLQRPERWIMQMDDLRAEGTQVAHQNAPLPPTPPLPHAQRRGEGAQASEAEVGCVISVRLSALACRQDQNLVPACGQALGELTHRHRNAADHRRVSLADQGEAHQARARRAASTRSLTRLITRSVAWRNSCRPTASAPDGNGHRHLPIATTAGPPNCQQPTVGRS